MKKQFFYAFCIAAIAMSCTRNEQEMTSDLIQSDRDNKELAAPGTVSADTTGISTMNINDGREVLQSGNPLIDWDKKIIKNAHVTLELKDYNAYNAALHNKLKSYGAYVAQEQQTQSDDQIANILSVKVPVDKFDDLMNSLSGDGIKVLEKTVSTEDVTGQVVDTRARIEAKKEIRARYIELLKQSKSMKDILEVQREINGIQEDIESATGRVSYLTNSSSYSTINLRYYQFLNGADEQTLQPGFMSKIADAFKNGGSLVSGILLFLVSIWPLLAGGLLVFIYWKKLRVKKQVAHVPTLNPNAQVSDTTGA